MEFLTALWLPILLSGVFVFVVSSILHMLVPIHRSDHKRLPDEDGISEAMRTNGLQPGVYMFPFPGSMKEMQSPEMKVKYERGPVGFMTIFPNGCPAIGKNLLQWFLYSILISIFVAYITWLVMVPDQHYMDVFRLTGSIAVMGYALSDLPSSIWKGQPWSTTAKFVFDGVLYGLVTAGTFAWLWPTT